MSDMSKTDWTDEEIKNARKSELVTIALALGVVRNKTEGNSTNIAPLRGLIAVKLGEVRKARAKEAEAKQSEQQPQASVLMGVDYGDVESRSFVSVLAPTREAIVTHAREAYGVDLGPPVLPDTIPAPRAKFGSGATTAAEAHAARERRKKRNQKKHKRALRRARNTRSAILA